MRSALSIGALLVTITSSTQAGNVVYVDANATGSVHDGSSWCSAYLDLQQALAVAGAGTEVRVAQGVYRPALAGGSREAAFAVPSAVSLLGSFQGCGTPDPDERDYILYATVLSGDLEGDDDPNFANRTDNVYHVVTTHDVTAATVLDGLTIRGGFADGLNAGPSVDSKDQGSGVNNYFGQPTLSNCTLVDNYSTNHGAFNNHGSATLIDCEFRDNWSGSVAAGLYMHFNTDTIVIGCEFHDNTTAGRGGGAYLAGNSAPTFSGCLFSGNHARLGGGMYCGVNNSPTLSNCTFNNNEAGPGPGRGGGVYAQDSILTLVGCTFQGNEVTDNGDSGGGAIYIEGGTLQLDQCDFFSNRSPAPATTNSGGPGGVYHNGTASTITRCLFDGNTGSYYGAAMRNTAGSDVTVEDCVFNQNSSYYNAIFNLSSVADFSHCRFTDNRGEYGAIHSSGGEGINISDSLFLNNVATQWNGAALSLAGQGTYVVTNTLFAGNVAAVNGGAIESNVRQLSLINCVFSGNSAGSLGGAMRLAGGSGGSHTTISNCSFFGHSADSGRAIAIDAFDDRFAHELTAVNSIFFDGGQEIWEDGSSGVSMTITYSNIEGGWPGVGNIAVNPMFVDPDGDDDLPGTEDDNLRLTSASPCIDVGDDAAVPPGVTTDLDGGPRFVDGDDDTLLTVDMGAYEWGEGPLPLEAGPNPFQMAGGDELNRVGGFQTPALAAPGGVEFAIRVRIKRMWIDTDEDPNGCPVRRAELTDLSAFEGRVRYLGPPSALDDTHPSMPKYIASELQCVPYFRDWSLAALTAEFGAEVDTETIYFFGAEIVPCSIYEVQPVAHACLESASEECFPLALEIRTALWGDIWPPFGSISFTDIGKSVDSFKKIPFVPGDPPGGAPRNVRGMLRNNIPPMGSGTQFTDIGKVVDAFKTVAYSEDGPTDCP